MVSYRSALQVVGCCQPLVDIGSVVSPTCLLCSLITTVNIADGHVLKEWTNHLAAICGGTASSHLRTSSCVGMSLLLLSAEIRIAAPGNRILLLRPYHNVSQPLARAYCQQRGGDMLTITNSTDDNLVQQALKNASVPPFLYWIGLSVSAGLNHSDPRNWRWLSTNQSASYNAWGIDSRSHVVQPIDLAPGQVLCSASTINYASMSGMWVAHPCNQPLFMGTFPGVACQQLSCSSVALPARPNGTTGWPVALCDAVLPGGTCRANCTQIPGAAVTSTCEVNGTWSRVTGNCTAGEQAC